jgi:hypothetical protein
LLRFTNGVCLYCSVQSVLRLNLFLQRPQHSP